MVITVTPADTTDRDAARELLWRLRVMQPQITQVWADSAYADQLINWPGDFLNMTRKTVSRPRGARGFVVLLRRWKVERTLGWIMKARRNVRDYECLPQHSEAHLTWALITLMTRRITRKGPQSAWSKKD
ncbi:transposase [Streptomyces chartreusis]|uniref:transposase n=1 Tax=Streptomyces chartreusis TaxID=1969 RepID=UPI003817BD28